MNMRDGITIAGNLIVDYVKQIDTYPRPGMLANILELSRSVGGCATNTSINLARIDPDIPIEVIGMVGEDENGEYVLGKLKADGIDTTHVAVNKELPTSFTDVMNAQDNGERTFFHARGANAHFGMGQIPVDQLQTRHFHIGYALLLDSLDAEDTTYGTAMAKVLHDAQQKGIKTSMDVVSESGDRFQKIVRPALKYCDYLIINEIEASMVAGIEARKDGKLDKGQLQTICTRLFELGVAEMVTIHAPEGACTMEKRGDFFYEPSYALPKGWIQGTVGAGDAFCAGMLFSIYHGLDSTQALKTAAAAAACNLSSPNSIDGMKNISEIRRLMAAWKQKQA